MADSDDTRVQPPSRAMRDAAAELIRGRPRAGALAGLGMALVFAAVIAPLAIADSWVIGEVEAGQPVRATVRVAPFAGYHGPNARLSEGGVVLARGEVATAERANLAREVIAASPAPQSGLLVFFAGFAVLALLYTANLRRSHGGKLLRTQAVNLAVMAACAVVFKVALLATSVSALIAPVAAIALLSAIVVDTSTGLATGLVAAVVFGTLVPLDLGVIAVLAIQAGAAVLAAPARRRTWKGLLSAGLLGGAAAAVAYGMIYFLANQALPTHELSDPLRSTWVAAAAAGPIAAVIAMLGQGLYHRLLGDISRDTLVDLEDLSHPLLKQIAERSPGTWQHSLAMANMAEIAANAIGASGRLVRTGAYYHDLGKSVQPKYFIENLGHTEQSPHDCLAPSVSCDAIFAHVTEGVRLARKHGLPERIIDFMHMHHGDGLLEYFWAKNVEQGNPDNLTEADFRYPGIKPQSKETAILAICDAVEAASRTLRSPDEQAIRNLVQRIVYGKLHLGQLDESGMTIEDLRKVSDSLIETVKHASHGRIEYPWQREERERARTAELAAGPAPARARDEVSANFPLVREPRLDSLDAPPRGRRAEPPSIVAPLESAPRSMPEGSQRLVAVDGGGADDDDEARVTNPIPIVRGRISSLPPGADDGPVAPDRESYQTRQRTSSLVDWEHALEKAAALEAGGSRKKPSTIELMKSGRGRKSPLTATGSQPITARVADDGAELSPGVVVLGPPPATHPRALSVHDEPTAETLIVPTRDAIRPSRVPTEERDIVIPPEAYPNDDTAPDAPGPGQRGKSSRVDR